MLFSLVSMLFINCFSYLFYDTIKTQSIISNFFPTLQHQCIPIYMHTFILVVESNNIHHDDWHAQTY